MCSIWIRNDGKNEFKVITQVFIQIIERQVCLPNKKTRPSIRKGIGKDWGIELNKPRWWIRSVRNGIKKTAKKGKEPFYTKTYLTAKTKPILLNCSDNTFVDIAKEKQRNILCIDLENKDCVVLKKWVNT